MSETEKITQLLDNLDSEQLDLIIEYIYKLKDLENIKARLDVESENTESFNSVDEWWDSVNED
ncbi:MULTISPECIES: actin-related protein 2/3 complex subunit 5 family protein [Enterococcus]|uniref:actin-related protein 2/3 complex subunit 5 family protein n=1 Tax=Enterococcus TaxID=1350 RepID=UPI001CED45A6|nr:actin-related protein 2/3 complex subunit 5 family protein [Enterococcus avium]